MIEKKLTIEISTFKDDKGVEHEFYAFKTELMGKEIKLYPSQNDKKLVNFLVEMEFNESAIGD